MSALAATEKQSRVIVVSSLFIRNPDSQSQCTLLLFVELELVDQELAFR